MKVMTILGTRPEIIRLSRIIEKLDIQASRHILVHTGQNWDRTLSDVFFQEMKIRKPDYQFSHKAQSFGRQMAAMFGDIERVLEQEQPDKVLVLGDTNSAMSAVLVERMGIPVYHMEAGNRCYDRLVPEEINRRMIDSVSSFNLPYTEISRENLLREGVRPNRIWVTGNPIYEVLQHYEKQIDDRDVLNKLGISKQSYVLVTIHRAENVDNPIHLRDIMNALCETAATWGIPMICSVHPRTRHRLKQFGISLQQPLIQFHEPFGFFDFVHLQKNARVVLTDSGTVQEESCIFRVPAVTIRRTTERPETVLCGSNVVSGLNPDSILECTAIAMKSTRFWLCPEGYEDANVSSKIVNYLLGGLVHV